MLEPVFSTGAVYNEFRRGRDRVHGSGFELRRLHFESDARAALGSIAREPENDAFDCPCFLPAGGEAWRELLIVLNGLNDSSYRKFFPWAASIARAGMPVLIFPSAFLMNRRPRAWTSPEATQRAWEERLRFAPESATPINAVLSQRVARAPCSLLEGTARTGRDLCQLAGTLRDSGLEFAGTTRRLLPNTRCHLLGYSLGGYLALALRLEESAFASAKVITFCAGASLAGPSSARLDLVSPFILDRHASEQISCAADAMQAVGAELGSVASRLVELFSGSSETTRARIRALDDQLMVITASVDRVVPACGIGENLGRIDAALPTGIHEYPFNLHDSKGPGLSRSIAQTHRVAPCFEPAFRSFNALLIERLCGEAEAQAAASVA